MHRLLIVMLTLFMVACSLNQGFYQNQEIKASSLVGRWSGGGEHWEFKADGFGYRTAYITPHVPFDGGFKWSLESQEVKVEHLVTSDWTNRKFTYRIKSLTDSKLVLKPVDSGEKMIVMERNIE